MVHYLQIEMDAFLGMHRGSGFENCSFRFGDDEWFAIEFRLFSALYS